MTDYLLQTKLFLPQWRPNLVSRPQLIERLNQGLQFGQRLTLVSAPAGFGKTTLVGEWANSLASHGARDGASAIRIAWISLDESDTDPMRFLAYFVTALNNSLGVESLIGRVALDMLQSSQPPAVEDIVTTLINEIAALTHRVIVILDDYHIIDSSPVDDALTFLVEHMPPQLHLVVATRVDPILPLARFRALGHLSEFRAADLRFSLSESAEFLSLATGHELSQEAIAALDARTEGWIAGLQLAALSMRGKEDSATLINSFTGSHRYVLDYLIEEVFEQQSDNVQTFLLKSSILNRMTGDLCDALTDQGNGQATLETLESANLFIVPLDEKRRWYRYHHLFSDLLQRRLRQTHPDWLPQLHRRAGEWYRQNGFTDEAIEQSLRSGDFEQAADLIEGYVDHILRFGERTRLRRWLDEIPEGVAFSKPHLCILHALDLYVRGHIEEAERYLQAADSVLGPNSAEESHSMPMGMDQLSANDNRKLRGRAATVRSYLVSYRGDEAASIRYARRALDYLPKNDSSWRWSALDSLGTAYSSMGEVSAYNARLKALEASRASGNLYMILLASLRLVVTLRDLGRLQQAIRLCQQQLESADENGLSQTALVGWLHTLWGEILAEKDELDRALELAKKGATLAERGKDVTLLGSSYLCLMRVLFSKGDLDSATELVHRANDDTSNPVLSPWIKYQMTAWQARIWVAQDKLDAANQWAEACGFDVDGELIPIHDFDYVVLARLLIAQRRLDESTKLLQRLLEAAEAGGRTSKVIEIKILQGISFHAGGATDRALSALKQALTLAEPGGYVRVFADEGAPMARLLHEALNRGINPSYVRRLLAAFSADDPGQDGAMKAQADQSELIEHLSEREIEVLELIAEGLTNPEIASRLYLSLNTVKVHTRNIYGKLDTHNRTQAAARARALGILSPI